MQYTMLLLMFNDIYHFFFKILPISVISISPYYLQEKDDMKKGDDKSCTTI